MCIRDSIYGTKNNNIKAEVTHVHMQMMREYLDIKSNYLDMLVFYRMGDFYELFYDDTKRAVTLLAITLTVYGRSGGNAVPMCGAPTMRSRRRLIGYIPTPWDRWPWTQATVA